ncbi:diguanylate cyclase [Undibacterium sp. Ji67W]|uniref:diguanylate cyclase n=1 Tax=Undibacterium sp. Ji67W TaxID=3413042 RepID=UPI003BF0FE97
MSDVLSHSSDAIKEILNSIGVGLIVVNRRQLITLWNGWIEKHSGVPSTNAIGKDISQAFSELPSAAFVSAISNTINYGLPVVLSNALHRSPLALYDRNFEHQGKRIQQSISLTPINIDGERHCLIQVTDSSTSIKREKILRTHSELLKKEATTDGLTGIYNRRFFDEHFRMALAQAVRQSTPLSIFMVDIDFFKQFNDVYGHIAGDKALIAVATALKKQLQRVSDVIARYGGEEFVLMLPNMQHDSASQFAEKLRLAVWDLHIFHEESDIDQQVTISIGYSTFSGVESCDPYALLGTADNALYNAKRSGKNRSVFLSYQPSNEQNATIL